MSDWYSQWRHDAVHELQDKNAKLDTEFRLSAWPRWDYDMENCTLTFSQDGSPKVIASVRLIGSTSIELNNWQWGWANKFWPRQVIEGVDAVRAFGEEHGIAELTEGWIEDAENLNSRGWELAAVAVRLLNGLGVY